MLRAEGTIFCHITARLAHEPDRRTIDRLTPAGFEEAFVDHVRHSRDEGARVSIRNERVYVDMSTVARSLCEQEAVPSNP